MIEDPIPPEEAKRRRRLRPTHPAGWTILISVLAVLLVAMVALTTRYGALTGPGRMLIESRANGLKLGRVGRLRIEGLKGDVFRDFTAARLTISDEKGVWLEARNVAVVWRYGELARRRFHAESIVAGDVKVLRRPTLTPKTASRDLPVSFQIDSARMRVETLPAFSYRRGYFAVGGAADIERRGGAKGAVTVRSLLHEGDFLRANFNVGKTKTVRIVADAQEKAGGAIAGSLGLAADQPFDLTARALGTAKAGNFTLLARSGKATPAQAQGRWNADGGEGAGRIRFVDSTLMTRWVARFGPEARISLGARHAKGTAYALDGMVVADNLRLAIKGQADLTERKIGPQGLAVAAVSPDLARLAFNVAEGSARVRGILRGGDGRAWSFTGTGSASDLTRGGYKLARAEGPVQVTWRQRELTITGQLKGQGGKGTGYLAALLGAGPTAKVALVRLAGGRLLLRSLDVTGEGLKVQASGGRALVGGGMVFKGSAEFTNLAAARAGAKGKVTASWSASRPQDGAWTYTADGRGAGLATGYAELDRLLGAAPRLKARFGYANSQFSLAEAKLEGAAAQAGAAGVVGPEGALRLKLDWNAKGPFRAGPLEVSGDAKGSGAITGTTKAPRADLMADFDAIDVPRLALTQAHVTLSFLKGANGTDGLFALTAASAYGPARADTAFRFAPGGLELTNLDADAGGVQAKGDISLRRGRPASADLTLAVGPGALLTQGRAEGTVRIVDAAGGPRAVLALDAKGAAVRGGAGFVVQNGRLTADGPLSRLPLIIAAEGSTRAGPWRIDGKGVLADQNALSLDASGRLARADFRTLETAQFRFGGEARTAKLRLAVGGGQAAIDASLTGDLASVVANLEGVALGALDADLSGRVDARLTLQGRGERLTGDLDATLQDARSRGAGQALSLDGTIRAKLADSTLTIAATATNDQGLRSAADLVLPVEASASPFRLAVAMRRSMSGTFSADGEVKPLWDLLIGGERELSGRVTAAGSLGGTLADPRMTGQASLAGGRFDDGATGLSLRDLTIAAAFADNAIDVSRVTAGDGAGGSLSGAGRISLTREGASSFSLDLTRFQLVDNDTATATASGKATIDRGADGKVRLAGALTLDRADIAARPPTPSGVVRMEVVERNKPTDGERGLELEAGRGPSVALDVTLTAPRRVFVKGRGLDAELSLDAHVGGTTAAPVLEGVARLVRGEYDFAGKRFEFDERGVVYLSTDPDRIRLDLSATREDPTLTAVIRIRGTASKPEITLTSTPVLPSDEVLSRVLFGSSAAQLSPIEAAQLASALAALAGGGGLDVIGGLRNLARLDRLAFAGGGQGSALTVAGGKYITDDVYLEIIGGGREGPAVQVEWRLRRSLAIVSRLAGQGDARLSVRWRRDY